MKARTGSSKGKGNARAKGNAGKGNVKLPISSSLKTFGSKGMRQPRFQGTSGSGLNGGMSRKTFN